MHALIVYHNYYVIIINISRSNCVTYMMYLCVLESTYVCVHVCVYMHVCVRTYMYACLKVVCVHILCTCMSAT